MPKETTNEELARMIKKGFDGVDKRFNGVDKRFDALEKRLDRIEKVILTDHQRRIERIEEALAIPTLRTKVKV